MRLKVVEALSAPGRVSSIDMLRCLAILSVVIFHFSTFLPLGFIGVDLFFVISGLLIGNILHQKLKKGIRINLFKFLLQRGLKIWPSYYFFFIAGEVIAYLLYSASDPSQIVPLTDVKRYIFFYQNYTGLPFHFSFDHVWSLCVEEHFYLLLPLLFIGIQFFFNSNKNYLLIGICLTIIAGILFKYLSFYITNSKDTYSATHNRIDALAWGVLLSLFLTYHYNWLKNRKYLFCLSVIGILLLIFLLWLKISWSNVIFQKIWFHSVLPFVFTLIIIGVYFVDFTRFTILRTIAYYSYNWYLWHPLFSLFIARTIGVTLLGLLVYLTITFTAAAAATIFVEEPVLKHRDSIITKLFS